GTVFLHNVLDAGDLDGDGDLDVVTSHGGVTESNVVVHRNGGDGTFAVSYETPLGKYAFAKLRDLDGDGLLDLLFVTAPTGAPELPYDFWTALGTGDGAFGPVTQWPIGACGLGHPDAFDLDGDGDLDVVNTESRGCFGGDGGDRLFISLNNGDGTFQPRQEIEVGGLPYYAAAADVDGDGALDLATLGSVPALAFGNGDGTFGLVEPLPLGGGGDNLLARDLNADGHADLAALVPDAFAESYVTVLLGDGTGAFTASTYGPSVQDFSGWLTPGDVDADGDLDLVAEGAQDAAVFLGDGAGAFAGGGRYGVGRSGFAPHYGDFTGDGVGDLVALVTREAPAAGAGQGLVVVPGLTGLPTAGEPRAPGPRTTGGIILSAGYPNPFRGRSTFTLAVVGAEAVTIAVFDGLGRRVAVLHEGPLPAGTHTFGLDGAALPAGVYVVRAVGETVTAARRVTLLR
ncbi:MAG: T9SS type A sorting domain-containing protein, partial [Rhodothermales bacterium]|nr:T9SS type A sorting domain-containing protein [Rhodothermales bacterium]